MRMKKIFLRLYFKRFLALILSLCLLLGACCSAFAADDTEPNNTPTQPTTGDNTPGSSPGSTVVSDGTANGRIKTFITAAKYRSQGDGEKEIDLSAGEFKILGVYVSNFYVPFVTDINNGDLKEQMKTALQSGIQFSDKDANHIADELKSLFQGSLKDGVNDLKLYADLEGNGTKTEIPGVEVNYYNFLSMMLGTFSNYLVSYEDFKTLWYDATGSNLKGSFDTKEDVALFPYNVDDPTYIKDSDFNQFNGCFINYNKEMLVQPLGTLCNPYVGEGSVDKENTFFNEENKWVPTNFSGNSQIGFYYNYLADRLGEKRRDFYVKNQSDGKCYKFVKADGADKPVFEEVEEPKEYTVSDKVLTYAKFANSENIKCYVGTSESKIVFDFYLNSKENIISGSSTSYKANMTACQQVFLQCLDYVNPAKGFGTNFFDLTSGEVSDDKGFLTALTSSGFDSSTEFTNTSLGSKMAVTAFGDIVIRGATHWIVAVPACMNPYIWQPVNKEGKDIENTLGLSMNLINLPLVFKYKKADGTPTNEYPLKLFNGDPPATINEATDDKTPNNSISPGSGTTDIGSIITKLINLLKDKGTTNRYLNLRFWRGSDAKDSNFNDKDLSAFVLGSSYYSVGSFYSSGLQKKPVIGSVGFFHESNDTQDHGIFQEPIRKHVDGFNCITNSKDENQIIAAANKGILTYVSVIAPTEFQSSQDAFNILDGIAFVDNLAASKFYDESSNDVDFTTVNFANFIGEGNLQSMGKKMPTTTELWDSISGDAEAKYTSMVKNFYNGLGASDAQSDPTALLIYLTYLYAGFSGGVVEGYKEEDPANTIGKLGYRLNFDNMPLMDKTANTDTNPSDANPSDDGKDGMLDAIKGWLYYLLNPKEGLIYIRVWFTNKVGAILCSIHNALLGTHGVGQTLGVTRYRSTTGFITMPDLSEMEWSSGLLDFLYSIIPYLIIAALILFALSFATGTLPLQKCIIGFLIFAVIVSIPIPLTNGLVGWTNRTLSSMYGEKFTYWAMVQHESYITEIDRYAQDADKEINGYENYLRKLYSSNSEINPNQGNECVQVRWQAPKKMQSLMFTNKDTKTTKTLFSSNSVLLRSLTNAYSGERYEEDTDSATYLYRSYIDISNFSRYIYRGLFGVDGAFDKRTRALKTLDEFLSDSSLEKLNKEGDQFYKNTLLNLAPDSQTYIDTGYMNDSMRTVSEDPNAKFRHLYAALTSKIVTDTLEQRGTIANIVDRKSFVGLNQDFFGFSVAMFNIRGKNVDPSAFPAETETNKGSTSETNADGSPSTTSPGESTSETNADGTPSTDKETETESDSEDSKVKTLEEWVKTCREAKRLYAIAIKKGKYNPPYSNSGKKKDRVSFTYKGKTISARRDCSGYVNAALYAAGLITKTDMKKGGLKSYEIDDDKNGFMKKNGFKRHQLTPKTKLKEGDILIRRITGQGHIEIYVGNGKVLSAGDNGQVKNKGTSGKAGNMTHYWRKEDWGDSDEDDPKSNDPDSDDSPNNGSPNNGSPNKGSPNNGSPNNGSPNNGSPNNGSPDSDTTPEEPESTRTFYSQLVESAKNPEEFKAFCEAKGYSEPEDANGDPTIEGLHPNELEYAGLATYGIYSESVFYYFSWLLYDYGMNPESSSKDSYKKLILGEDGNTDFFYNNVSSGNGELKDFMDMRGLFTYVIPYLKRLNDIVIEWDDYYGLKYYKGISSDEGVVEYSGSSENAQKYWNNLNTARLYNIYTPWVDLMYDCSYAEKEDIIVAGERITIEDPIDPSSYPADKGRPMIFSQSQMVDCGLTEKDLTKVEKIIINCNEDMEDKLFELLNYSNFNDVTLNTIAAMECTFEFNKNFSEEHFLIKSKNNIIYPQTFELADFSYDAYLRYILSESTGESIAGNYNGTKDFYMNVLKNSSLITGLVYIIVDIVSMYLLPWAKIIFVVLTLLAGMFVILISLFSIDKTKGFLSKFWNAFLFPIIGFTAITLAMGYLLSLFMGKANNAITQTDTLSFSFGDPVTAMLMLLVIELVVLYCYVKFISRQFATVKSNGSVLLQSLQGVVGGIGLAVSGAFTKATKGNKDEMGGNTLNDKDMSMGIPNERAENRSKAIEIEDNGEDHSKKRSSAEERLNKKKENLVEKTKNNKDNLLEEQSKEEFKKEKEEESRKAQEISDKVEQGSKKLSENIHDTTQKVTEGTRKAVEKVSDATDKVVTTTEKVSSKAISSAEKAADNISG